MSSSSGNGVKKPANLGSDRHSKRPSSKETSSSYVPSSSKKKPQVSSSPRPSDTRGIRKPWERSRPNSSASSSTSTSSSSRRDGDDGNSNESANSVKPKVETANPKQRETKLSGMAKRLEDESTTGIDNNDHISRAQELPESINIPDGLGVNLADIKTDSGDYTTDQVVNCFQDFATAFSEVGNSSARLFDLIREIIKTSISKTTTIKEHELKIKYYELENVRKDSIIEKNKIAIQLLKVENQSAIEKLKDENELILQELKINTVSIIKKQKDENQALKQLNTDLQEEQGRKEQAITELQEEQGRKEQSISELQEKLDQSQSSLETLKNHKPPTVTASNNILYSVLEKENETMKSKIIVLQNQLLEIQPQLEEKKALASSLEAKLVDKVKISEDLKTENTSLKAQAKKDMKDRFEREIAVKGIQVSTDILDSILKGEPGNISRLMAKALEARQLNKAFVQPIRSETEELNAASGHLADTVSAFGYYSGRVPNPEQNEKKGNPDEDEAIELKNKLAAKEEAVAYFKGREKELQLMVSDLKSGLTKMEEKLQANRNELIKVKENYLAFLKKNVATSKEKPSPKTSPSTIVKKENSNAKDLLWETVKGMNKEESEVRVFYNTLMNQQMKHEAVEKSLQRDNLNLRREYSKARRIAGKVLYKNPISESTHKRSKEREDNMAILRLRPGAFKNSGDGSANVEVQVEKMLLEIGPIPTLSVKVITDDVVIVRTPVPFSNMPGYVLGAFGPTKPISLMHVSSWNQLIVHNVPINSKVFNDIHSLVVWLHSAISFNSVSGVYSNTLACYPRMVNPLEFFSKKETASFILCYTSKEVYSSALRYGIMFTSSKKSLRTEPVLGYMRNPFNQAGFLIQFDPLSGCSGFQNAILDAKETEE